MDEVQKALSTFRNPYNCAQAVQAAFEDNPAETERLAACGGGKAPEGLCGALYAALSVANETNAPAIRAKFREIVGAETCKEIKSTCKTSCPNCVEAASTILKSFKCS